MLFLDYRKPQPLLVSPLAQSSQMGELQPGGICGPGQVQLSGELSWLLLQVSKNSGFGALEVCFVLSH